MSLAKPTDQVASTDQDAWYLWPFEVDWRFYSRMLRLRGEARVPRMLYLDGDLLLMTPSQPHEERKERLSRFVTEVVTGPGMAFRPTGSTTWRRSVHQGGVEGDLTYYITSMDRVRGKPRIDLRKDPPPDLAIEVVYTHNVSRALEVYRRLGIPEVWVATEKGFEILVLRRQGRSEPYYESTRQSQAFPLLSAIEVADWIYRPVLGDDEAAWTRHLRTWVSQILAPRRAAGGQGP